MASGMRHCASRSRLIDANESHLFEELRRRQEEWIQADGDNREGARQRFMGALAALFFSEYP
jgi:hypothetical protein